MPFHASHRKREEKPLTVAGACGKGLRLRTVADHNPTKGIEMPKEEWGVKRICPTTGRRFYDLNKDPIVSPYTGEVVTLDENTKTRVAIAM